jgi:hypothetical protein
MWTYLLVDSVGPQWKLAVRIISYTIQSTFVCSLLLLLLLSGSPDQVADDVDYILCSVILAEGHGSGAICDESAC